MLFLHSESLGKAPPSKIVGMILKVHGGDRMFFPAIATIGLILLAVQWSGGARNAEFDGHPDESAQFVSGRMIWEYLTEVPRENPVTWAKQYYLHYPKVAIGHWPPGYHLAEAFWSLIFGSSRNSAMWLQWFTGLVALMGLYTLARPRFPLAITGGIVLFAIATPVFQQGLEQTMSDLACLLCSVFFIHAMLRLLKRPDATAIYLVLLSLLAAAMMKGTAVCLVPVPAVALLLGGRRLALRPWWPVAAVLIVMGGCFAWYASTSNILNWSGMRLNVPWPVPNLGRIAGWGFVGLAALGARLDEPLSIVAASLAGSAVLVSYPIRAMNEPRHWIIVLPAILLLAGYALTRFDRRVAAALLVTAVVLFPFSRYRQTAAGCKELIRQLHLPARMMVSAASANLEGALIAETSLTERYPASFVARASKVLAASSWNGDHYKLLTPTPSDATRRLDELALDIVIVELPSAGEPPHAALLRDTMANSPSWQSCGRSQDMLAYCRAKPPAFPRKPLVLDVGGWRLVERIEPGH